MSGNAAGHDADSFPVQGAKTLSFFHQQTGDWSILTKLEYSCTCLPEEDKMNESGMLSNETISCPEVP